MALPYKNMNGGDGKNANDMPRAPSKEMGPYSIMEDGAQVDVNPDSPKAIPHPKSVAVEHNPAKLK